MYIELIYVASFLYFSSYILPPTPFLLPLPSSRFFCLFLSTFPQFRRPQLKFVYFGVTLHFRSFVFFFAFCSLSRCPEKSWARLEEKHEAWGGVRKQKIPFAVWALVHRNPVARTKYPDFLTRTLAFRHSSRFDYQSRMLFSRCLSIESRTL